METIVDRQLQAYNSGDFETFAACYTPDILSYDFETGERIPHLCGDHFFQHYRKKFSENPHLCCTVTQRTVHDNLVVDKEIISHFQSQDHRELVVYRVENGLINKMWFSKETL